ncbi:RNA-directed DNA polymerase [Alkalimonas sp. NCh-2]|uniref:RNA-directed DNA polymerase n=1 Tax=Alkalimonas sp. NCh-2 TaxID=3144846 RepID=UPI0031F6C2E4
MQLQQSVNDCTWQPMPSTCFIAVRPKAREIHAPDFSDRVVHHWLVPQLEALWEPAFIHDSYANRKGKGSHAAVTRLQQFIRQVPDACYLQLDIHNFFNSIHRPTLWAMLKNKLIKASAPAQVMHATHALLKHHPLKAGAKYHCSAEERAAVPMHKRLENSARGCGLPIGNLSSQFFANVYLDALDQFVKHELKAKRYLRYVDDFVLIHQDKTQLTQWQHQIEEFIAASLQLKLKQDIRLKPLTDGVDFLGYVVRPTHTLTRQRVVTHFKEALSAWERDHVTNELIKATPESLRNIKSVISSYMGHIKQASSQRLIRKIVQRYPWINAALANRKFDYRLEGQLIEISIGDNA